MALKDALARVNKALADTFHTKPYDPAPGRAKVAKLIDNAARQHNEGKTRIPNRAWEVGFNSISFKLVVNGQTIPLDGDEIVYLPPDEFQPFLKDLKAAVEGGELDDEIKEALNHAGGKTGTETSQVTRKRAPNGSAKSADKPWHARSDWDSLERADKQSIGRYYSNGKNPDGSVIADVGHKPDAPLVRSK